MFFSSMPLMEYTEYQGGENSKNSMLPQLLITLRLTLRPLRLCVRIKMDADEWVQRPRPWGFLRVV